MSQYSLSDFDYHLPQELIAAFPPEDRPSAKMLHISRETGKISHLIFRDIKQFLKKGDVLVLNNTKVIPARLFGVRRTGGQVEALLLKETGLLSWKALLRPGGRIKKGAFLKFGEEGCELDAEVLDDAVPDSGERLIQFCGDNFREKIQKIGHIPLPPYIDRPDTKLDREMYQTVYAQKEGAVASPTAGLHFDKALLAELEAQGVEIVYVTLHTSYGTFQPVAVEELEKHQMFSEEFEVTPEAAEKLNRALSEKRRIVACGTTSVRTLESAVDETGKVKAQRAETKLFVYPPYQFKVIGGMITNFHLPKSSLLLLVAAFLGMDKMKHAYEEAIENRYRFYSYGDAMLIL